MKKNLFYKLLSIAFLALLFSSCRSVKINYSLEKIKPSADLLLKDIVLDIEVFEDRRKEHEKNKVLFTPAHKHTGKQSSWYYNLENNYKDSVAVGMSEMLVNHLRKRGTFRSVKLNKKDSADYYVKGSLHYFYGAQLPGKAAALIMFSYLFPPLAIPGIILTFTEVSETVVIIEIRDLVVYDRKKQPIANSNLSRRYERNLKASGGAGAVYRNTNTILKEYFEELIVLIERDIKYAEDI